MQRIIQWQHRNRDTQADTGTLARNSRQESRRGRYRTTIVSEVMFCHPSTVEAKFFKLLYLLEQPPVEFRDRPVKLGHISGQKMGTKLHPTVVLLFFQRRQKN